MSSNVFYQQQKDQISFDHKIPYTEIIEILNAFQIASGQGFAIGKTKALLDYIKEGHSFTIENFANSGKEKVVSTIYDLVKIYKNIDPFVDLTMDKDFKEYFS